MSVLPRNLYRTVQVREMDRMAIDEHGIPGIVLMERAGDAAWNHMSRRWPDARRVAVLCGSGNNGGDGFIVARQASATGLDVRVFCTRRPEELAGDARLAADALQQASVTIEPLEAADLHGMDVVVDALLGTGLDREVSEPVSGAIDAINRSDCRVLALDVPSGLDSERGCVLGRAVKADATVTFVALKQGLFTGDGPDCCGELAFADLSVPPDVYASVVAVARRVDYDLVRGLLPPQRPRNAHKGLYGHVLVVGGDYGFAGAVRMTAEAAARVGSGLVSVATRPEHALLIPVARPELMARGIGSPEALAPLLERAGVIAVGPGLGNSDWSAALFSRILETGAQLVVDADGLNLLARDPLKRNDWILTPHPGEAARLLGCTSAEVQKDRFAAANQLRQRYGGTCVLKGCGTVIAASGALPAVCSEGNPGMASGGQGDVLTGIIAGLLAQDLDPGDAALLGVCLHAAAGDRAARDGERGLLAGDLVPWLRRLMN